jgi:hypothetical protein
MALAEVKALLEASKDDAEVKAYLAELAKPTLDGVKQFLATGKEQAEVKELVGTLLTADAVRGFLEANDDGKKLLLSVTDKRVTDAIATFQAKTVPGLIAAEIAKLHPEETPEQKRLKVLEQDLASERSARGREALRTRVLARIGTRGLPAELTALADQFVGADEATTDANLRQLEETFNAALGRAVEAKFKTDGTQPPNPPKVPTGPAITREGIKGMTRDQINKAYETGQLTDVMTGRTQ